MGEGGQGIQGIQHDRLNIMADPVINGIHTVMLVCGDDETAGPVVLQLATDVGEAPWMLAS